MLKQITIKNIALIENLTASFGCGLNILSGETGAGKSIIIDSLNFVLGERADKTLIRFGEENAYVEAVFEEYQNSEVLDYLTEIGVEAEEILILSRVMSINGKNECRINGHTTTLGMLKGLTQRMVDIHGQHEHQSLLNTSSHIQLLDNFGGKAVSNEIEKVKAFYYTYKQQVSKYNKFGNADDRARKLDILAYQIDELEKTDLIVGEEDELLSQRKKFRNLEKIVNSISDSNEMLNGNFEGFSAIALLNKAKNMLSIAGEFDNQLGSFVERLDSVKIELKDISESLKEILDKLQYDDLSAEKIEERLELVRSLSRKFGGSVDSALEFLKQAKAEFDLLSNADEECARLENEIKKSAEQLLLQCDKLSKLRRSNAKVLEKEINKQLNDLGMKGSRFVVSFIENTDLSVEDCSELGFDKVEFLISANVGEPEKPLAKIISGGEMSRFMLALKNIIAKLDNIFTIVFDEIDTGISGNIAQVVSEKLFNISCDRQVIAVTHLPQLASMADLHYKIEKFTKGEKTVTELSLLDFDGQISEIARLIGGSGYSEHAIPHAKEMKAHSNGYKSQVVSENNQ